VANGRHARGKHRSPAPPARHRRPSTPLPPTPGAPAVVAGAAAVAVAAVGGLTVADAQAASGTAPPPSSDLAVHAVRLDEQLQTVRQATVERQVRASRERNRQSLAARQQQVATAAKAQQAAQQAKARADRQKRQITLLAKKYVLPLDHYRLTAGFGAVSGLWSHTHTGQDFAAPIGTPVHAVADGVITSAEWAGAYGWRIIVRHADGTETWYCHLSAFLIRSGKVQAGEMIGRVGATGNVTGPHLHLEVRINGQPVDPRPWLRAHGLHP
jgi:murein DD-endopeptidase MepM/ murein hydrolase activator NlpD